jgi:hypothetical protein
MYTKEIKKLRQVFYEKYVYLQNLYSSELENPVNHF